MIRIPRGRGGLAGDAGGWRWALAAVVAIVALAGAGCSSQKPEAGAGASQNGLGQQGLGGSDSLSQFQKGKLGADSQGPLTDIHFDYN
ncbi:MAG: hypothetical protein ACREQC_01485, partial [Candidatus Binataceae bacterium]